MTKIEKQIWWSIAVVFMLLVVFTIVTVKALEPVVAQIEKDGVHSIFDTIWNGKGK